LTLHNLTNLLQSIGGPAAENENARASSVQTSGIPLQSRSFGKSLKVADRPVTDALLEDDHTWKVLADAKKRLIEAQCPGLVEFIEPKFNLDMVAGHTSAKARFTQDAELIRDGRLDAVPMGYLLCGPVGVGKTFMAMCYAGSVGIPSVILKNFRSKYVGETEENLEKILQVLGELGPVAVIIDEADAAVGNRGMSGDSGTSSRVFAQLAARMGDTGYRGKTIWFLLTSRPDFLPVDLKRQGRCEEHVPLFYPETPEERTDMFVAMGRKLGLELAREDIPENPHGQTLSGADIEALLTRVRRESLIREVTVDHSLIADVEKTFRSPRSPEHDLQVLAAIMECSDIRYLPPKLREAAQTDKGWEALAGRFNELKMALAHTGAG
jgi:SpoVK/Ycf46/Vps4 family AAA+-type ATPase